LQLGWQAVAGGEYDAVLCLGADRPAVGAARRRPLIADAQNAKRYMSSSGATVDHFARVAVKNRRRGADNPRALNGGAVDAAAVMRSDVVAWPLHRLMVATPAGGAAAAIFAARDVRRSGCPVAPRVRASVLLTGTEATGASARAARLAYESSGLGPEDVDVAEVDDLTAAGEVMAYEALQFAPEGQGPELIDSGFTALGGVLPVNPSGGMLSQGDAFGASSIAQVCEIAWQLRREAGSRQVAGARVGLAMSGGHGRGGMPLVSLMMLSCG
jgi:acetyl-CoA acetyltransferase